MKVHFTPDQEGLIRHAIASGRYETAEEALRDAMARWEDDERSRLTLLAAFDEAEDDLEAGRFSDYASDTLPVLAGELIEEARTLRHDERG